MMNREDRTNTKEVAYLPTGTPARARRKAMEGAATAIRPLPGPGEGLTYLYLENPVHQFSSNGHGQRPGELLKEVLRQVRANAKDAHRTPKPMKLPGIGAEPRRPHYLVGGLLERSTVNLLAADTGALKSWMAADLVRATVTSDAWLGREVHAERILYIDEEMPEDMARDRLQALGVTVEHADRGRYYSRQGFNLGEPGAPGADWLRGEIEAFRPDLVVIDSAMAATATDVLDNSAIVGLFKALRPIAEAQRLAFIVIHHERKQQAGNVRTGGQGIMGGRQFVGQSDTVLGARKDADGAEVQEHPERDDRLILTTKVRLEFVKVRRGIPPRPELVVLESEVDGDYAVYRAELRNEGEAPTKLLAVDAMLARIIEALPEDGAPLKTAALASEVDTDAQDRTFKRALSKGLELEQLVQPSGQRGTYARATDQVEVPF